MQYVAMEWDHAHSADLIKWVVMECAGLQEEENGAIQALPPRRDVAYFLRPASAEVDAVNFAKAKNREKVVVPETTRGGYRAYPWDHCAGQDLIQWAVLRSEPALRLGREDVAYFVCASTAKQDATLFETLMNHTGD